MHTIDATGRRHRLRLAIAAGAVAAAAATGVAAPAAQAQPPSVASVLTPHQAASAPYEWLFAMNVPVYELVKNTLPTSPTVKSSEMIFERLTGPRDGAPGSKRFVFVGKPLPNRFFVASQWGNTSVPGGMVARLKPNSDETDGGAGVMILTGVGPIGEIRYAGLVTPYYG